MYHQFICICSSLLSFLTIVFACTLCLIVLIYFVDLNSSDILFVLAFCLFLIYIVSVTHMIFALHGIIHMYKNINLYPPQQYLEMQNVLLLSISITLNFCGIWQKCHQTQFKQIPYHNANSYITER